MLAAFVTRLKMVSTAFWFHQLNKLPRALCNCSKTKSCATRWERKPATPSAKNFCCHAMSSSIWISSPNSENDTLKGSEVVAQPKRTERRKYGHPEQSR